LCTISRCTNDPVLIIGCGTYHPIASYIAKTSSPYPIYTNPSLSLYQSLEFKSSLAGESKEQPQRDYMKDQGSYVSRVMGGVKGALSDLGNLSNVGPKSQNGGEVIISAGECLSAERICSQLTGRRGMRVYLQNAEHS
jgi:hypothetical protein